MNQKSFVVRKVYAKPDYHDDRGNSGAFAGLRNAVAVDLLAAVEKMGGNAKVSVSRIDRNDKLMIVATAYPIDKKRPLWKSLSDMFLTLWAKSSKI